MQFSRFLFILFVASSMAIRFGAMHENGTIFPVNVSALPEEIVTRAIVDSRVSNTQHQNVHIQCPVCPPCSTTTTAIVPSTTPLATTPAFISSTTAQPMSASTLASNDPQISWFQIFKLLVFSMTCNLLIFLTCSTFNCLCRSKNKLGNIRNSEKIEPSTILSL